MDLHKNQLFGLDDVSISVLEYIDAVSPLRSVVDTSIRYHP